MVIGQFWQCGGIPASGAADARYFDNFDVLLLPIFLHQPPGIAEWENLPPEEAVNKMISWIAPSPIANASGLPAIALPTLMKSLC